MSHGINIIMCPNLQVLEPLLFCGPILIGPNFSAYVSSLPPHVRPHLEVQLDWDKDIDVIAHHMLDWEEKLRSHLGLTEVDVHDIKAVHGSNPGLQRYVTGLDMQDFHIKEPHP